ncbi:DUF2167 domain-containing protein [Lysobacter silvisoli]|uniref:DUF2167 domain-containing protein n=1 Tax=Lysobacter silvisoli TaxID=2293254 RepID=A0A371K1E4_9GAMM|nr:DUF2167 domain-containing protein [Lysobacter silvisoli]RDZ27714.1 DUF2167 domain-containing protein [Lysobacter silvisoli]
MWKWMLCGLLAVSAGAHAQAADEAAREQAEQRARAFAQSLQYQQGQVAVAPADAQLKLGKDFRYLGAADAQKVLEQLWGNPPDSDVLGLIVPAGVDLLDEHSWAVVVTYVDEGYVSDEDAAKIDYAQMLKDMQEGTQEANAERRKAGYEAIELVGWAEPPRYDAATKKLYWAKELAFEGSPNHTLNYDIRVLGRRGYLSLNAVAGMGELAQVRSGMQRLLPQVEFDAGARYADYDSSTDKTAAYGLAALVGGGLAAKAGLFAKIGALLLGLKKLLIPLVLVVGAAFGKLIGFFRGKKRDQGGTVS